MRMRSSCEGRCWFSPQWPWLLLFLFRVPESLLKYPHDSLSHQARQSASVASHKYVSDLRPRSVA